MYQNSLRICNYLHLYMRRSFPLVISTDLMTQEIIMTRLGPKWSKVSSKSAVNKVKTLSSPKGIVLCSHNYPHKPFLCQWALGITREGVAVIWRKAGVSCLSRKYFIVVHESLPLRRLGSLAVIFGVDDFLLNCG